MCHALWEAYHGPDRRPRPAVGPSKEKRDALRTEESLRRYPVGTRVRLAFADAAGNVVERDGVIFDFQDLCWRIRHLDGDWKELNEREVVQAKRRLDLYRKGQHSPDPSAVCSSVKVRCAIDVH